MHSLIPNLLRRLRSDERHFILATSVIVPAGLATDDDGIHACCQQQHDDLLPHGFERSGARCGPGWRADRGLPRQQCATSGGASSGNGTLGNGTTFSYTVTSLTSSSSPCTGLYASNSVPAHQPRLHPLDRHRQRRKADRRGTRRRLRSAESVSDQWTLLKKTSASARARLSSAARRRRPSVGSNGSISFCNSLTMTGNMKYSFGSGASAPSCWNNPCATNSGCSSSCVLAQQSIPIG